MADSIKPTDNFFYKRKHTAIYAKNSVKVKVPSTDKLIDLDDSALDIWDALEYPSTVSKIASSIAAQYGIEPSTVEGHVTNFISQLEGLGLVEKLESEPSAIERARFSYLKLLKRSLVNAFYPEHELRLDKTLSDQDSDHSSLEWTRKMRDIRSRYPEEFEAMVSAKRDAHFGNHPSYFPHTMIGLQRLDNLEYCAETVFAENIPGDFIEAGACQGGATVFLRGLQVTHKQSHRKTWVADSFQGLPPAESEVDVKYGVDYPDDKCQILTFDGQLVRDVFSQYQLLDDGVEFLEGWFEETLPSAPIDQIAILRIDADLYKSTKCVLDTLYQKVSSGGFIIIDDYGSFPSCKLAVDEFREENQIASPLEQIDWEGVYWRKE